MIRGTTLTEGGFGEALASYEHTAFRLELQPAYAEPAEAELVASFLAGHPADPIATVPGLRDWFDQVARQAGEGKRMERVRVHDEPPTGYQQFERWLERWNIAAGETMRYLTRRQAYDIGLLPAAGPWDWWLLDSTRLVIMEFDADGHRIRNTLTTDPEVVLKACMWRDLAVHHATLAERPVVAA